MRESQFPPRLLTALLALGCVAMSAALLAYAINGSFMRMIGEDYCYAALVKQYGFWQAQRNSYVGLPPYSGNRYSLTFFSGVFSLLGPRTNGLLPAAMIALWVAALAFSVRQACRLAGWKISAAEIFLLATFPVFSTLYQAPELAQVLYWRSGMLPYLAPLVANTALGGLVLALSPRHINAAAVTGIAVLAIIAGGFSETAAALQFGYLALCWLVLSLVSRRLPGWASNLRTSVFAALVGTAIALSLLIASPGNTARLGELPVRPDLLNTLTASLRRALRFVYGSLEGLPVPNAYSFVLAAILSFISSTRQQRNRPRFRHQLGLLVGISLSAYLLIVCTMAPSAYAQSGEPEPRAQIISRFVMVLAVASLGWITGQLARNVLGDQARAARFSILAIGLLLPVLWVYPLRGAAITLADAPWLRRWSMLWDMRDTEIRAAQVQGILHMDVIELDHPIPRVGELQPDPDSWYNNCAEAYYGMEEIRASLPGWDP